jgi:hypothetical protein
MYAMLIIFILSKFPVLFSPRLAYCICIQIEIHICKNSAYNELFLKQEISFDSRVLFSLAPGVTRYYLY